jgi:hypothetical protein
MIRKPRFSFSHTARSSRSNVIVAQAGFLPTASTSPNATIVSQDAR